MYHHFSISRKRHPDIAQTRRIFRQLKMSKSNEGLILLAIIKSTAPTRRQTRSATGFSRPVTLLSIYLGSPACTETHDVQSCHITSLDRCHPALTCIDSHLMFDRSADGLSGELMDRQNSEITLLTLG